MTDIIIGITTPNVRTENAIRKWGATPLIIDSASLIAGQALHGIIIPGNRYDVPPRLYGQEIHPQTQLDVSTERLDFEIAVINHAYKQQIPLLAICGGAQLLNVVLGGTLIQHIPDIKNAQVDHRQPAGTLQDPSHSISVLESSRRLRKSAISKAYVNSDHHQAIDELGKDLAVIAVAEDGVIEGVEHMHHPFMMGLQWHPEYFSSVLDEPLFDAFVDAAFIASLSKRLAA
ncbi:MAG: gamma-glutamyl-gamma-aminobutyrate hydrolase family protein [Alphaproteobacteria bacterium]|nr:gamma-glutamyl-gamma-aminobutyrate hydrolase family protein [Alphaproteobacteria bacterium]